MITSARDECLTFLNGNISTWLSQLAILSEGTEARQVTGAIRPKSADQILHGHKKVKHMTGCDSTSIEPLPPTNNTQTQRYDGVLTAIMGKRKRRSSSLESPNDSGCNRYRAQNAKVVLYDSSAQKVLEKVVDDLTKAKNLIRKAKAQARMCNMRRRSSSESDSEDSEDIDDDTVMAQVRLRRKRTSDTTNLSSSQGSATFNVECLDKIDRSLSKVQDLCITAAYQLLRDGDCCDETDTATEELEEAMIMIKEEIAWIADRSVPGSPGASLGSAGSSPVQSLTMKQPLRVSVACIDPPLMPPHLTEAFLCPVESY